MKKFRHLLEFVLAYPIFFLIYGLPIAAVARLVDGLGWLWFTIDRRRRRICLQNIERAGITADPREARRIARQSIAHFGHVVVESLKSGQYINETNWQDRVALSLPPETEALMKAEGKGLILAAGHFGNWEVAAQVISWMKPVTGITRPLNNPYIDRLMQRHKPRHRFKLTPKHDANTGRFMEVLRGGEVLAYMVDQHAGDRGMQIPFFGHPASTHSAIALLHLVTRTPICYGSCRRVGPLRYEMRAGTPIRIERSGDKQKDIETVLLRLNAELERDIREAPEQFLWAHRRWRDHPQ